MFDRIISFSLENKLLVAIHVIALIVAGVYSMGRIPLDAVPDITNNQVQIVSVSPTLAPQEVEQLITYPLEVAMTNIPDVVEVRSISRYGLSVITVVFKDAVETMTARQYVQEQLNVARANIPAGLADPELMPITTGLGEIYQYVLTVDAEHRHLYDATELRTIQDWIVKRQLNGTPGIIEVSSFGGFLKQYEVAVDPLLLKSYDLTMQDVIVALETNNENSGGSYIEKGPYSFYIRTHGRVSSLDDIGGIVVKTRNGTPVTVADIGGVRYGSAKRYGAMTMDGRGEVVGGITLMLKGANSSVALANVRQRVTRIQETLPEGVHIYPYLDRSKLIGKTINTVRTNLIEGGIIVILILLLLLGNLRAGLIVASIIPLSMLFAFIMMHIFGISANLMSLGAIDFGIVVDGAVIIVESLLFTLSAGYVGKKLTQQEMDSIVMGSTSRIYRSAAFGVLIILIVFIPILTLQGTEGKTFRPMAQTVGFAILGSLILSLTYVPVISSLVIKKTIRDEHSFSDKIIDSLKTLYTPLLRGAMTRPVLTIGTGIVLFAISIFVFSRLGAEFVPTLEEGDLAMQQTIKPGSALEESVRTSTRAEAILIRQFPEIEHVVSKIGTAEVPTDPMAIEEADIMIILKDKEEWVSAHSREGLIAKMKAALEEITWAEYEFTQPIQLRFNELMTGAKSDISIKIFGEDMAILHQLAEKIATLIPGIPGVGDVRVDQTEGLQQLTVHYDRKRLAQYGVSVEDVNQIIRSAYAGEFAGVVFENERKFDLVVRLAPEYRDQLDLAQLNFTTSRGDQLPLSTVASVVPTEGPMLIRREQARRFINIGVNVRNRDVASLVSDISKKIQSGVNLPAGYEIQYGGQFENLRSARARLLVAVPAALALILLLLHLAFNSFRDALIIFVAVPLSAIGGVAALYFRDMPFSISSGIGFIALFGVSVLNGIVLVSAIKFLDMKKYSRFEDLITDACLTRLRPVLMTALVAAFGFLPMALSTSNGAEVQRPLATVVIGGLISSTLLTLFILPAIYRLVNRRKFRRISGMTTAILIALAVNTYGQNISSFDELYDYALEHNPTIRNIALEIEKSGTEVRTIGQWPRTQIQYQGGNINFTGYDNMINIQQDLTHLFNQGTRRDAIESNIALQQAEQVTLRDNFAYRLKSLYYNRMYWLAKLELWERIEANYSRLEPVLRLQHEAGSVDAVTLSLAQNELLQVRTFVAEYQQMAISTENALRANAFLPDTVAIDTFNYSRLTLDTVQMNKNLQGYLDIFNKNQEAILTQAELYKKIAGQPELQIGFFTQNTLNTWGYHGVTAALGIPIDWRTKNARLQQLEIQKEITQNSRLNFIRQYNNNVVTLIDRLNVVRNTLDNYDQNFFANQEDLLRRLELQLTEGSIDFVRYHYILSQYLNSNDAYLDLLKAHNDAVLSLMHFIP